MNLKKKISVHFLWAIENLVLPQQKKNGIDTQLFSYENEFQVVLNVFLVQIIKYVSA